MSHHSPNNHLHCPFPRRFLLHGAWVSNIIPECWMGTVAFTTLSFSQMCLLSNRLFHICLHLYSCHLISSIKSDEIISMILWFSFWFYGIIFCFCTLKGVFLLLSSHSSVVWFTLLMKNHLIKVCEQSDKTAKTQILKINSANVWQNQNRLFIRYRPFKGTATFLVYV